MIKLYRNIPSLHRFVALAPLASIRTLTIGRCLIQYLPFEQKSANGATSTAHLFLIRHAGEMNSVQQVCDDLSSAPYYYPFLLSRRRKRCDAGSCGTTTYRLAVVAGSVAAGSTQRSV